MKYTLSNLRGDFFSFDITAEREVAGFFKHRVQLAAVHTFDGLAEQTAAYTSEPAAQHLVGKNFFGRYSELYAVFVAGGEDGIEAVRFIIAEIISLRRFCYD